MNEHAPTSGLGHRTDYDWGVLLESDAPGDPLELLDRWLSDAESAGEAEFNSMALVTVRADGSPTIRNVLLRGIDADGRLQFFTNRSSAKGVDIAGDPRVALLFSWLGEHRQVRLEGTAAPTTDAVSDEYFASRPRESRIGAWASEQSSVIADRAALDDAVAAAAARFGDGDVPRPPDWGGYDVTPTVVEFWQGRPSRLHDRLRYRRDGGAWHRERLAP